jgi:Endoribonuclease L-PSP
MFMSEDGPSRHFVACSSFVAFGVRSRHRLSRTHRTGYTSTRPKRRAPVIYLIEARADALPINFTRQTSGRSTWPLRPTCVSSTHRPCRSRPAIPMWSKRPVPAASSTSPDSSDSPSTASSPATPGDFRAQATQAFENLKNALAAVGAGFEHVLKLNNYLRHPRPAAALPRRARQLRQHRQSAGLDHGGDKQARH